MPGKGEWMERLKKRGHDECGRLGAREGFVSEAVVARFGISEGEEGAAHRVGTVEEMEEGGRDGKEFGWRRR